MIKKTATFGLFEYSVSVSQSHRIALDWKLKYSVHPHYPKAATNIPDEDKGWAAQRYLPSAKQSQLLQQYGGKSVSDFFYGDGMFRLFKDMQDWDWIETYKGLLD